MKSVRASSMDTFAADCPYCEWSHLDLIDDCIVQCDNEYCQKEFFVCVCLTKCRPYTHFPDGKPIMTLNNRWN